MKNRAGAWVRPRRDHQLRSRPKARRKREGENGRVNVVSTSPLRVACIGMGWWSDVLADAIQRSGKLKIIACYSRSNDKREAFAAKYGCLAVTSYEAMLDNPSVEAVINTTPNDVHLETTSKAAAAGKHVFLDKPIANTV